LDPGESQDGLQVAVPADRGVRWRGLAQATRARHDLAGPAWAFRESRTIDFADWLAVRPACQFVYRNRYILVLRGGSGKMTPCCTACCAPCFSRSIRRPPIDSR